MLTPWLGGICEFLLESRAWQINPVMGINFRPSIYPWIDYTHYVPSELITPQSVGCLDYIKEKFHYSFLWEKTTLNTYDHGLWMGISQKLQHILWILFGFLKCVHKNALSLCLLLVCWSFRGWGRGAGLKILRLFNHIPNQNIQWYWWPMVHMKLLFELIFWGPLIYG